MSALKSRVLKSRGRTPHAARAMRRRKVCNHAALGGALFHAGFAPDDSYAIGRSAGRLDDRDGYV